MEYDQYSAVSKIIDCKDAEKTQCVCCVHRGNAHLKYSHFQGVCVKMVRNLKPTNNDRAKESEVSDIS